MSKLNVSVPHELGQEEALRRVKGFLDIAQNKLASGPVSAPGIPPVSGALTQEWKDGTCAFSFSAQGLALEGTIEVTADQLTVTSKLPLAALMFKGKLESSLRDGIIAMLKK